MSSLGLDITVALVIVIGVVALLIAGGVRSRLKKRRNRTDRDKLRRDHWGFS